MEFLFQWGGGIFFQRLRGGIWRVEHFFQRLRGVKFFFQWRGGIFFFNFSIFEIINFVTNFFENIYFSLFENFMYRFN